METIPGFVKYRVISINMTLHEGTEQYMCGCICPNFFTHIYVYRAYNSLLLQSLVLIHVCFPPTSHVFWVSKTLDNLMPQSQAVNSDYVTDKHLSFHLPALNMSPCDTVICIMSSDKLTLKCSWVICFSLQNKMGDSNIQGNECIYFPWTEQLQLLELRFLWR